MVITIGWPTLIVASDWPLIWIQVTPSAHETEAKNATTRRAVVQRILNTGDPFPLVTRLPRKAIYPGETTTAATAHPAINTLRIGWLCIYSFDLIEDAGRIYKTEKPTRDYIRVVVGFTVSSAPFG
ncbi:MAG: hypothetical protein NTU88_12810 [Armatimonadetes bacterium]|nr:hypothetical protein [Armatimonadota bacterium]